MAGIKRKQPLNVSPGHVLSLDVLKQLYTFLEPPLNIANLLLLAKMELLPILLPKPSAIQTLPRLIVGPPLEHVKSAPQFRQLQPVVLVGIPDNLSFMEPLLCSPIWSFEII